MSEIVVTGSDDEVGSFSWTLPDDIAEKLAELSPEDLEHVKTVISDAAGVSLALLVAAIDVDVRPLRMQGVASLIQTYRNLIPDLELLFELAEAHVVTDDARIDNS